MPPPLKTEFRKNETERQPIVTKNLFKNIRITSAEAAAKKFLSGVAMN